MAVRLFFMAGMQVANNGHEGSVAGNFRVRYKKLRFLIALVCTECVTACAFGVITVIPSAIAPTFVTYITGIVVVVRARSTFPLKINVARF